MSTTPPDSPLASGERKKVTTLTFRRKKLRRDPITVLTAYDYPTALAMDQAGIDSILVGDSLGMVVLGYPNTLPVTMDDMLHHCKAVARGAQYALLIGDMPFMSYQASVQDALRNAGRFLQEAGMDAVKLEGGRERLDVTRAIVSAGIPVMGHLGLTPQSVHQLGGFRPQGREVAAPAACWKTPCCCRKPVASASCSNPCPTRLATLISSAWRSPPSASAPGRAATGRCWSLTTCWACLSASPPSSSRNTLTCTAR